ncbi:MAG: hypothetical protein GQ581_07695 [Methyloprofundus sp.]|nr:hypothetical protein [Methyloprofundus sp.]
MSDHKIITTTLAQYLASASHSFSIGSFGAIAEFHRDRDEKLLLDNPHQLTLMTLRGAIQLNIPEHVQPIAYEVLSKHKQRWQQGVAFCLPKAEAKMHQRNTLTELGKDQHSMLVADQDATLFDMGVDADNIDFCVRTADKNLIELLRQSEGQSFAELDMNVKNQLIEDSPTRVITSKLGRIEIYQPIGKEKTPQGPHTHLLPKLLAKQRTHSANIPLPDTLAPCLTLHPANPLVNQLGQEIPFDLTRFEQFATLFEQWGLDSCKQQKNLLVQAVLSGTSPEAYPQPDRRETRATLRITLRQMHQQKQYKSNINRWLQYFEKADDLLD